MEKKNQVPKYPPLRFPEFTDEWKEVKLGEVTCERNETNNPTLPLLSITANKGVIPQTDSEKKDVSNADKSKYKRICSGDIGYNTMRMWQGRSALSFIEGIVSPAYTIVTPLKGVSPLFLSYLIKRPRLIYEFWTHSQGLVEDTLNCKYKDFAQIAIALPSLAEQRKIAALLSLIDERIEVQNAIIKEQEAQKAALLRRLFDRTLRFPEFTDEWKVVKLGEVGEKQHAKNADDSIDRVYTNSAQDGIVEQTEFFDKEIANGNNLSGYYIVKQYDFVYNPRLSKTAPVGAMNLNKNTGIGLVSPLYTVFRITARSVLNEFLEYLFESTSWHGYMNEVANFGARSDRMNIKDKDFFNLPLRLPSLLEQRKIAALLSAVDERIAVEKEYATLLQKQKAYLLRQMFV